MSNSASTKSVAGAPLRRDSYSARTSFERHGPAALAGAEESVAGRVPALRHPVIDAVLRLGRRRRFFVDETPETVLVRRGVVVVHLADQVSGAALLPQRQTLQLLHWKCCWFLCRPLFEYLSRPFESFMGYLNI